MSQFLSDVRNDLSDASSHASSATMKGFAEFRDQIKKHMPFAADVSTIESIIDGIKHLNSIDDRKMLLEHVLVYLSQNSGHPLAKKLETATVQLLYLDLPHPPSTSIGPKYAYRSADGRNNNPDLPNLGRAGMPYARSVQQTHALPRNEMPDAGLVFDTLLRREKFVPHPAGLSSMMFSFAALVIHTVFRTSHKDVNINETSSYVDLAPLYGHNEDAQKKIRVFDGRGLLKPDTFAEDRLLLLPPAVCVLLVLFNRNHNYIARKLLELNERLTYKDPSTLSQGSDELTKQEEDLFQTARLINCAWFASAVFSDYFSAILGLVREGNSWSLNPFEEIRNADHSLFERGRGNVCSVEFNCLYRWHATTSEADEKWVEQLSEQLFPGRTVEQVTIDDFKSLAKTMAAKEPDVSHWTFGGLQRDAKTSRFDDGALADILKNATEHPAGKFKARGTPYVMRLHEIMGIEQNRQWGVCSLNDFRQFLGLKTYSSFIEWNSDPAIAAAAEKLYGTIDRLELYVGLQAEESKPVVPGAGLCPAYTISRAILSDAIALTRGDRFFTADYTPFNMTSWGFADCQRDPDGPGNGSILGRLLLRTLPEHYTSDSTYTWFPLMTPPAMQTILTKLGDTNLYSCARPGGPEPVQVLGTYADARQVLKDEKSFATGFADRVGRLVRGNGFFIASADPARAAREQRAMLDVLVGGEGGESAIRRFFFEKTRELILRESYTAVASPVRSVDIVRDVFKAVPIHWVCELTGIKLKLNGADSNGDYTPAELFDVLADVYTYLFLDVGAEHLTKLQRKVTAEVNTLLGHIRQQFGGSRLSLANIFETVSHIFTRQPKSSHDTFAERLHALGYDSETQANAVLALLVGATVELSQEMVHVLNYYLDPLKPADVQALVSKPKRDPRDDALLQGYVLEALRLDPTFRGVYRDSVTAVRVSQGSLQAKQRVFVDIATANTNSQAFSNPDDVNTNRGLDKYLVGDGAARCLGLDLSSKIVGEALRAVYSFPSVARGPGNSGMLKRYEEDSAMTSKWSYLGPDQHLCPWATSMVVQVTYGFHTMSPRSGTNRAPPSQYRV
ncbi:Linoleate 10R-lipoxygenase [Trametes pubescens]|uniref:Linoleate 10R-lipoxygenase n=1 Tax=Trametes pubescens TaxID=154538 RepID=A0A1M2V2U1_TRAPU|nr:Linoleate 10R-lipoxygenase [Trametes pubescens]